LAVTRKTDRQWALPSENEWYKAAFHKNDGTTSNYFDYPTGSDNTPGNVIIDPDPGNNVNWNRPGYGYTLGNPYWRSEAGEFENSASPYGTFDQAGNVQEWNEAIIQKWHEETLETYRGLRGGSFRTWDPEIMRVSHRSIGYPTGEHDHVGFRVVEIPEPISLSLLGLGSLTGFTRRRSRRRQRREPAGKNTTICEYK